jgi:tetratricopeptide (TPR) repeat protein
MTLSSPNGWGAERCMGLFNWFRRRKARATLLEQERGGESAVSGPAGKKGDGSSSSAHERGMAYLKRGEYTQAMAKFSEAIALDPEAPNAYVGRALAYRSLGDEEAAVRDEEAARKLGGPEQSAWDRLVNRANRRWRSDLRDPAWGLNDPLSRNAVLLRHWSWQIFNGGLPQWVANGYGELADDLACAAEEVGTNSAREMAAIVRDVARVLNKWSTAREAMFRIVTTQAEATDQETEIFEALSQCEERYHRVANPFEADLEAWLERRAGSAR